jgi:fructose/tagatose bisphosphate aldolase
MNIDTDLQFAFAEGIRDYMIKKHWLFENSNR